MVAPFVACCTVGEMSNHFLVERIIGGRSDDHPHQTTQLHLPPPRPQPARQKEPPMTLEYEPVELEWREWGTDWNKSWTARHTLTQQTESGTVTLSFMLEAAMANDSGWRGRIWNSAGKGSLNLMAEFPHPDPEALKHSLTHRLGLLLAALAGEGE